MLAYLNGSSDPPARWARVVVGQGATEQAQYAIYTVASPSPSCNAYLLTETQVGPLPVNETTEGLPLSFCYNSGRNYVLNPMADPDELTKWAVQVAMNASDITLGATRSGRSRVKCHAK